MTIDNDIVSFESKDIGSFSDAVQKALVNAAGENRTPEELLSSAVNREIQAAGVSYKNSILSSFEQVAETLVAADDADRAAVQAKIDEIKVVLKIPGGDPLPFPEAPAQPGFFARLFNFK